MARIEDRLTSPGLVLPPPTQPPPGVVLPLRFAHALGCMAVAALASCSSQQLYAVGQEWQRTECQKIDDRAERMRCQKHSATSYESYRAQTDGAKKP
jgi:hypothetical protein